MSAPNQPDPTAWVQECSAYILKWRQHITPQDALSAARDLFGLGWSASLAYTAARAACEPLPGDPPYTEFEWAQLYIKRCLERFPDLAGDDASEMAYIALDQGKGAFDPYDVVNRVSDPVAGRGVGEPHELPKRRGLQINPPPQLEEFVDDA